MCAYLDMYAIVPLNIKALYFDGKNVKTPCNMISTSKWHAKNPLAGQNTQHSKQNRQFL